MITREEIEQLWVGDELLHIPSGNPCKFESYDAGTDRTFVRINGQQRSVARGELRVLEEGKIHGPVGMQLELDAEETGIDPLAASPACIDLHIDQLSPHHRNMDPVRILDVQVKACADYLTEVLEYGLKRVIIIHGKGTGRLRDEVMHLLKMRAANVSSQREVHDGGAVEVWFN